MTSRSHRDPRRTSDLPDGAWWWVWAAPLLPLLCVALGGATARWSQGVMLVALGAMLVAAPPKMSAGWGMHLVLGGLAALALAAFLPGSWFTDAAWRTGLEDDLAVQLPATRTPQPWLTAESLVVFLAGAAWFYSLWTRPLSGRDARRIAGIFGAGVGVLAGLFVLLYELRITVPIWPTERRFGPFPNRNQTADFLAVGSLLLLGCARLEWRAGRTGRALAWIAGWLVSAWGVFLSYSRAGVVILIVGTGAYIALELRRSLRRGAPGKQAALRRLAMAATGALILFSGFLLLGGDTLDRFRPSAAPAAAASLTTDFRLRIQRDAVDLADANPALGVGLGNFGAVFPFYRLRSALPARAIHPESDWLWLAGELGWGAVGLAIVGCGLIARRMWPAAPESERALRAAAALAVAAFAAHGLVDVSAHRVGSAFSAILLMGIALRPPAGEPRRGGFSPAWIFRGAGVAFAGIGLIWIAAATRIWPAWPGLQGVERLKHEARAAAARRDFAAATRAVDQALAWAPLEWTLYFARASADLGLGRDPDAVLADFRRARYLEPYLAEAPMTEAKLWLIAGQAGFGVNALAEACRREPENVESYVGAAFSAVPSDDVAFHDEMATLARINPAIELPFYEQIVPPESVARIAEAVRDDPELRRFRTDAERIRFFRIWAQRGDIAALAAAMSARPDWQKIGWRWWADARARADAPQEACDIARRFAPAPKMPPPPPRPRPLEDLRSAVATAPTDPALALQLYYADPAGALAAVRRVAGRPASPRYFQWLDAQLSARAGEWSNAWQAWQKYLAE